MIKCNWVYEYTDTHKHELWYKCKTCGLTDWFAYYDLPEKNYKARDCKE